MAESKHSWTEQELWVVSVCYKEKLPIELALRLTNTSNEKSMRMRYQNCLFLDKGPVEDALSHASKKHQEVWEKVEEYYTDVEPVYVPKTIHVEPNNSYEFLFGGILMFILMGLSKFHFC
jgi:hypothetical protein